jgi:glucokinase
MQEAVLLMDVGGTHTRARLIRSRKELLEQAEVIAERNAEIADKQTLLDFIGALLAPHACRVSAAVLSFAGPVTAAAVTMTNWKRLDAVRLADVTALGLPETNTAFINDMEAAAYCLIAHQLGWTKLTIHELYAPAERVPGRARNAVLIIPGTGVGVAGVVMPADPDAGHPAPVSCELQHTAAAGLDADCTDVLQWLAHRLDKRQATWEDLVSGLGLENLHHYFRSRDAGAGGVVERLSAADVAARAVADSDRACIAALDCYYHAAGALAQVMALVFQPYAGVYLGGGTTVKNSSFIRKSSFVRRFQDNPVRGELLRSFPVYLVPEYLNLTGALFLASRMV